MVGTVVAGRSLRLAAQPAADPSFAIVSGMLALVGGAEWRDKCSFDRALLEASGNSEVVVLPTAAAYEHPERAVEWAERYFEKLGGKARGLMVLNRRDAEDEQSAATVRDARFLYLSGGSPMHLRSVLKDSAVWHALVSAWNDGAVLAASSAGAMVLCDPMVDPRGGAFTLGLALVAQVAVIPHHDTWSEEKARRTIKLAPPGLPVVAIDEQTALLRHPDGSWSVEGAGRVVVFCNGHESGLEVLPT
ncbi:MAG: Type 1 glutamine amidotransferase-like domain-containing protein [Actinomycetota bacterium]|nr:Type 1 glutamine amidotransferase-like domain-containing protein [Actinomycetota bacterium]